MDHVGQAISRIPGCIDFQNQDGMRRIANGEGNYDPLLRTLAREVLEATPSREKVFMCLIKLVTEEVPEFLGEDWKGVVVYKNCRTCGEMHLDEGEYQWKQYPLVESISNVSLDSLFRLEFRMSPVHAVSAYDDPKESPLRSSLNTDAAPFVPGTAAFPFVPATVDGPDTAVVSGATIAPAPT
jgi:hypothetical protein